MSKLKNYTFFLNQPTVDLFNTTFLNYNLIKVSIFESIFLFQENKIC